MLLTSDDLKKMDQPLTAADWVRILRDLQERTTDPFPGLMLDALLRDQGMGRRLRAELTQELPTCTPRELSMIRNLLLTMRTAPDEHRKPDPPGDEVAPLPGTE